MFETVYPYIITRIIMCYHMMINALLAISRTSYTISCGGCNGATWSRLRRELRTTGPPNALHPGRPRGSARV